MLTVQQKKELVLTLDENIVTIVFMKSNGERRTMRCTLIEDFLPKVVNGEMAPWLNPSCAVWDVDKDGWRSFRFDSILEMEYTDKDYRHFKSTTAWTQTSERNLY